MVSDVNPSDANSIVKKTEQAAVSTPLSRRKVRNFVEEIKAEIKQITWTSRDELLLYTKLIVASTFLFGMGIYLVDLGIQGCLNLLVWLTRVIIG